MDKAQIEQVALEARTYPQFVEQYLAGTLLLPRTKDRIANAISAMGGEEVDVDAMVADLLATCRKGPEPTAQVATLRIMADIGTCTSGDVARELGVHMSTASNTLQALAAKRLVVRGQRKPGGGMQFALNRDWRAARESPEALSINAVRRARSAA